MKKNRTEIATAVLVMGLLCILVAPIPSFILDGLLSVSIGGGILLLFLGLQARRSLDLSTFPSLLLLLTLFRLAINVASTRLILLEGDAGDVIAAFGQFVVGGDVIVGIVVFAILLVIQFVVITKGAERVAEVAARFTLDSLPGKQMAIDADLNAGLIDEPTARERRVAVSREAEFYGAMDGASKFVRGDAIASLIIVGINLIGGVARGLSNGLSFGDAFETFAILTVGDALSSQVPALLISTAAGIVVTKGDSQKALGAEIAGEVASRPLALAMAAIASAGLGLVPGLPLLPFLAVSGALAYAARAASEFEDEPSEAAASDEAPPSAPVETDPADSTLVDRVALDVGLALVQIVDGPNGLVTRIAQARRRIAARTGFVVPVVRIRDDLSLPSGAYRISLDGVPVARGEVVPDNYLVIAPDEGQSLDDLPGLDTHDPAFGLEARWIPSDARAEAEVRGLAIADAPSVVVTHLSEIVETHAEEILSRDDVEAMLERVRDRAPASVKDVVPELIGLGVLQRVLRGLLRERVSISNLPRILESLADRGKATVEDYVEVVRTRLARMLREDNAAPDGTLHVITVDPETEDRIAAVGREDGLTTEGARRLTAQIQTCLDRCQAVGLDPVLLTRSDIRRRVRDLVAASVPEIVVLSHAEVLGAERIEAVELVSSAEGAALVR